MKTNILYLFSFIVFFYSCSGKAQQEPTVNKVDANTFEQLSNEENVQLVDVRTPQEFDQGHLKGAQNINFHDAAFRAKIQSLDTTQPVLVYCGVGGRSAKAAQIMNELGFVNIYDLQGGIKAWQAAGKPIGNVGNE